jgi:hypothetical protein
VLVSAILRPSFASTTGSRIQLEPGRSVAKQSGV